jgi:predicted dinucleotide-binding enzyme
MRVGIPGSGLMGRRLGTLFARARHEVVFSYVRSQKKLEGLARAGTPGEVARHVAALLLAVHWSRMDDVLKQAGDLSKKVIVSCSLPMNESNADLVVGHISSGVEELSRMLPKARVVSAFNTLPSEVLFEVYEAKRKASPECGVLGR